ncbi:hypothetical protein S9W_03220, partial [Enterococcus faecalis EnGen0096]
MENREKIIQLLKNPLVTGYGIEIMSNGRLYSANFQRYKNRVKKEKNPLIIFESMTAKVEQVFLELAEEVIRTNPKTKQEFKDMTTEQKTFDGYQFEKITGNASGVFTENDQEIVYVYKKVVTPPVKQSTITVRYIDEEGNQLIDP